MARKRPFHCQRAAKILDNLTGVLALVESTRIDDVERMLCAPLFILHDFGRAETKYSKIGTKQTVADVKTEEVKFLPIPGPAAG